MTTDPNTGYLVTGPTNSAENSFKFNGWELALSMMPTCDRVLVHELYTSCIEASKILNTDTGFRDSLQQALAKFPPLKTVRTEKYRNGWKILNRHTPITAMLPIC